MHTLSPCCSLESDLLYLQPSLETLRIERGVFGLGKLLLHDTFGSYRIDTESSATPIVTRHRTSSLCIDFQYPIILVRPCF